LQLAAYIVTSDAGFDAPFDKNALRQRLKTQLPDYMVPACFVRIAQLPLTTNGKVDYRALPSPAEDDWRTQQYVAPATDTERALADVWQQVIGIERIGIHDNFFELGGHSLMATQILAQLKQRYRVEIELRKVFEEPTIAAVAALIDAKLAEHALLINDDADVADDDEEFVL
jgi:acyl carrier protein